MVEAIKTAFETVTGNANTMLTQMVPLAATVVGALTTVKLGFKFFKSLVQ